MFMESNNKNENIALTDIHTGLSKEEVAILPPNNTKKKNSKFSLFCSVMYSQMKSIFFVLLLASALLSFGLGSVADGWIFIVINLLNLCLGTVQDFRALLATDALETLVTHKVSVIRNGQLSEIQSIELVEGDILLLGPGDVISVDVYLREVENIYIDESVLTGESAPVEGKVNDIRYAGTSVASGTAKAQVYKVGAENSLSKYGDKLKDIRKSNSFNVFLTNINKGVFVMTLFCILLTFIFSVLILHKITFSTFVLYGISMLVGVVPESLAIIVTIMLTRESLMLAKERVIVKHLASLQELGSMDFLLTDKTGTLTENSIRLVKVEDVNGAEGLTKRISQSSYEHTPMENAFDQAISAYYKSTVAELEEVEVIPFNSMLGYSYFKWRDGTEVIRGQYAKVCEACNIGKEKYEELYSSYESQGLRIIAVANKNINNIVYNFSGMLVFEDPLKSDAAESYKNTEELGIKVKILTGDSALVAEYVARKLDPKFSDNEVCDLDIQKANTLTDEDIHRDRLYARCHPDDKLALIDRHLAEGTVGFLGEGINDALALRRADVGIVVSNASDVARQSADIILLEKSLNPISVAIKQSRRVFEHIITYLLCTLTGNIGTLFSLTIISLWWKDIPMLPIQILLNNLLTDVPLMLLMSDALTPSVLAHPLHQNPRKMIKIIALFAFISTIYDLTYFMIFQNSEVSTVQTGWFVLSVIAELVLVLSLRSTLSIFKAPKMKLPLALTLCVCACLAIVLPFIPYVSKIFHFVPLPFSTIGYILGTGVLYLIINEIVKYFLFLRARANGLVKIPE